MTNYYLFLDDCRECYSENTIICRNYDEFVKTIEDNGLPIDISFDHDLGNDYLNHKLVKDGKDCAEWLVNYCIKNQKNLPKYSIHSSNPVGVKRIQSILSMFEKHFSF